jgi:Tfp pilus assembly protein PilN
VKAVNLIPAENRRGMRGSSVSMPTSPSYLIVGLLVVALAFVTVYVLTSNTISSRKAKVASLKAQVAEEQASAARLSNYVQFAQLAQTRAETVRQIAAARFNWSSALSDLSKVVPSNTSLQVLTGTVVPGASPGGTGGAAGSAGGETSSLRTDNSGPAFQLTGCTKTQDDVARLMSRLRVINGVTRVSLADTQKPGSVGGSSAAGSTSGGCGANAPTFDVVVFFSPVPNAGAAGVQSIASQQVSTTGAVK